MVSIGLGYDSFWAVGIETDWGTEVARTNFYELNKGGDGLGITEDKVISESTYGVHQKQQDTLLGPITCAGDITSDLRFEGIGAMLLAAFGTVESTAANGTDAYQHRFTLTDELDVSLSVETKKDLNSLVCIGCKVNKTALTLDTTGLLKAAFNLIGKDGAFGTSSDETGELSTSNLINAGVGSVTYGGTEKEVTGVSISLDNVLKGDRRFVGSRTISEPVKGGKGIYGGSFSIDFADLTEFNDFRAATPREFVFSFEGDTIKGTTVELLKITFPAIQLSKAMPVVKDEGPITVDVEFRGYSTGSYVGTDREVYIDLVNTKATVDAGA